MQDIDGRVAVVTGGGEGIGRGIAHALADAGARIAIADIDRAAGERVAAELSDRGAESQAFVADVADANSVQALAGDVEAALGPVSILCNNAGVMVDGPLADAPDSDWQWVLNVNILGVVHGVQAFVPRMRANGIAGHIMNTGSMAGLAPRHGSGLGIYSASKAAIVSYSEMLREELAPEGIEVSVLCPSTVSTRIWEADRNRPAELGQGKPVPRPERSVGAIDGMAVGPLVVRGIRENRAYIFTGLDSRHRVEARHAHLLEDMEYHEANKEAR